MNIKEELNNLTIRKTMNTVEINKSIMELNLRKEQLQMQVDGIQEQIYFLASLRESQRPTEDGEEKIKLEGKALFDDMFGGTD
jgi:predicted nuclease with TOPRIM domain